MLTARRSVINVPFFFDPTFVFANPGKTAQINKCETYTMSSGDMKSNKVSITQSSTRCVFQNVKNTPPGGCWNTFGFFGPYDMKTSRDAQDHPMTHNMCKFGGPKMGGKVFKTCLKKMGAGLNWQLVVLRKSCVGIRLNLDTHWYAYPFCLVKPCFDKSQHGQIHACAVHGQIHTCTVHRQI